MDNLAGVANTSAADMSDLGNGLAIVGASASGLGLSLFDTASAIGVLTNAGLDGANAGTSLRQMLLELTPTTKPAIAEMKKLGLITEDGKNQFFDAAGNIKDFTGIAQLLQDALKGMSKEEQIAALNTLFTRDAINAASIIAKQGAQGFNDFERAASGITTAESARTRLDNLTGAMKNLGGSVELLQIQIGTIFLPIIRQLAVFLTNVTNALTQLSPQTQQFAAFAIAGTGAVLGLVGGFVLIAPFLAALPAAFGALGAVLAVVFGPIGLAVAALALIAGALVFAFNNSEQFRAAVLVLWDAIQNNLVPSIAATANALGGFLGPIFDQISQLFLAFVSDAAPKVLQFFQSDLPNALAAMGAQVATLQPLFSALEGFFGAMFNVIGSLASVGGTALQGLFQNVLVPGLQALGTALAPLQPAVTAVGDGFKTMVDNIGPLSAFVQALAGFFNDAAGALNGFAVAVQTFQLPDFLKPGTGASPFAPGGGPAPAPANFTPGGPTNQGPLINIGNINISDEAQRKAFVDQMSEMIMEAARRVSPPPDNSGNPALASGATP